MLAIIAYQEKVFPWQHRTHAILVIQVDEIPICSDINVGINSNSAIK